MLHGKVSSCNFLFSSGMHWLSALYTLCTENSDSNHDVLMKQDKSQVTKFLITRFKTSLDITDIKKEQKNNNLTVFSFILYIPDLPIFIFYTWKRKREMKEKKEVGTIHQWDRAQNTEIFPPFPLPMFHPYFNFCFSLSCAILLQIYLSWVRVRIRNGWINE